MTVWKPPRRFGQLTVAAGLVEQTILYLAAESDAENIVYWAGVVDGMNARVTRVITPLATRGAAFVLVRAEEVGRVVNECHQTGDFLVAQIHTHPGLEDHSTLDDCGTVSKRDGFISLVVPFYAQFASLRQPGWFGYELQNGDWLDFDTDGRILLESHL